MAIEIQDVTRLRELLKAGEDRSQTHLRVFPIAQETSIQVSKYVGENSFYLPEVPPLSQSTWEKSDTAGLSLVMIPGFIHSEVSFNNILAGKQWSGLNEIYTKDYLQKVSTTQFTKIFFYDFFRNCLA